MVISFPLQLLKVTPIYWVQLKKQQILETPTILNASFKQVMTNMSTFVCYSPKKRESLQQAFASQSPVKIVGTKKSSKKPLNVDTEDHCISKHARNTPADHLSFPFNPSMGNHLHTVKQVLEGDMYEIVQNRSKVSWQSVASLDSRLDSRISIPARIQYRESRTFHWESRTCYGESRTVNRESSQGSSLASLKAKILPWLISR